MEDECKRFLEGICAAKSFLEEIRGAYFTVQDGKFVLVGGKLLTDYGYTAEELIGQPFIRFVAPEKQQLTCQFYQRMLAGQQVPEQCETVILVKEQIRVPIEVSAWLVQHQGRPSVAGIARDLTEKKKREAEFLRIREEECRRLAQELHDDTIQELLLVGHRLQAATAGICGQMAKPCRELLIEARALVERSINEIRRLTYDLRPAILDDMGLVPALRWLVSSLATGDGLHTDIRLLGEEERLSPETELALFRIAQESLSNVRRHAHASVTMVVVEFADHKVTMSVSDDGKGFELPPTPDHFGRHGGIGLAGIIERVRLLGGKYNIQSEPGKGTIIRVEIPT